MSISQLPSQLTTKVPNLIPSDETHLPLYLHIQRFLVTNEGKEGLYHIENGKLVALNLSGMNLGDHDLDFLANCPDLQSINLSGNAFTRLEFPNNLPNLEYINISKNPQLKTLIFTGDLPNLKRIYAGYGGIESINFSDGFNNLELIELQENQLSNLELPEGMETLRFLDLSENKLESLSGRGNYKGLQTLYLENNRLTEIKKDFLTPFPKLIHLRLDGNPLHEAVLSNISDSSTETLAFIRRYITDLAGDSELDKETKVLLLGNGNVGKTCLVRRMVDNMYVKEWKSTHAISLDKYPKSHEDDPDKNLVHPYILNLWDFGGQDLYHATHRLFMQHNAVYLILWDNKTENLPETIRIEQKEERSYKNHFLQYWLAYAESQGKNSPVIVVQTKKGRDGIIDKPEIREVFGPRFSFLEFAHVESEENDWSENGYEDLMYQIKKAVRKVKTKAKIPKYWTDIRRKIRAIQKAGKQDYMEMPDFYQLAEKVEDPMDVLNWLTQSGVVFYQKGLFNDEIILNQAWAIEAIYTLFDRDKMYYRLLQSNDRGEFSGQDLSLIWEKNSEGEKELFVSFMLSCEMCFETTPRDDRRYHIPFDERTFIAPQLLKPKTDQVELVWRKEKPFFIRFEHDFLHDGVIQRFIVRAQKIAKVEQMWLRGILLTERDEMVQVEAWEKLVLVKATPNASRLLAKIRKELSEVQGDDIAEFISLDGEYYASVSELKEVSQSKNTEIKCTTRGREEVDSKFLPMKDFLFCLGQGKTGSHEEELLEMEVTRKLDHEGPEGKEKEPETPKIRYTDLPKIYFSYDAKGKKGDEDTTEAYVDILYNSLSQKQETYQVIRDKMNVGGYGGLISDFIKEIGKGDLIVVFISSAYLRSAYCMKELYEIALQNRLDQEAFSQRVLPIHLEELDLDDPDELEGFYDYWEGENEKWTKFVERRLEKGNLSKSQSDHKIMVSEIEKKLGDLIGWLANIHASSLPLLEENDYQIIRKTIEKRLSQS